MKIIIMMKMIMKFNFTTFCDFIFSFLKFFHFPFILLLHNLIFIDTIILKSFRHIIIYRFFDSILFYSTNEEKRKRKVATKILNKHIAIK